LSAAVSRWRVYRMCNAQAAWKIGRRPAHRLAISVNRCPRLISLDPG
jgi:hypothetical protein